VELVSPDSLEHAKHVAIQDAARVLFVYHNGVRVLVENVDKLFTEFLESIDSLEEKHETFVNAFFDLFLLLFCPWLVGFLVLFFGFALFDHLAQLVSSVDHLQN
jgi:hypothetical protein